MMVVLFVVIMKMIVRIRLATVTIIITCNDCDMIVVMTMVT